MSFFSRRQPDEPEETEETTSLPPSTSHSPIGFETVIGSGCSIEGSLSSQGNIRLDGEFSGTLGITGNVLVGETAKIRADINAKNISIAGSVRGNVSGKKVQLLRTGRVWGDITATALTTEEGAFIDGKISMMSKETEQSLEEPDFIDTVEVSATETEEDDDDTAFIPRETAQEAMDMVEEHRIQGQEREEVSETEASEENSSNENEDPDDNTEVLDD